MPGDSAEEGSSAVRVTITIPRPISRICALKSATPSMRGAWRNGCFARSTGASTASMSSSGTIEGAAVR
jgi:hypothetical protein